MAAKTKIGTDDLLEQFKEMTLLELSEFIKAFEEAFDVQAAAAAPVMMAAPGGAAAGGEAGGEEEQSEFDGPHGRRGQEDPGDQGGPRADEPQPEGGEGPGRLRAEARAGEGVQGRRRAGEGAARGGGSLGRGRVKTSGSRPRPTPGEQPQRGAAGVGGEGEEACGRVTASISVNDCVRARVAAGLSQSELEDISASPRRGSRYENGHVEPSIQTLARLSRALNVSEASPSATSARSSRTSSRPSTTAAFGSVHPSRARRIAHAIADLMGGRELDPRVGDGVGAAGPRRRAEHGRPAPRPRLTVSAASANRTRRSTGPRWTRENVAESPRRSNDGDASRITEPSGARSAARSGRPRPSAGDDPQVHLTIAVHDADRLVHVVRRGEGQDAPS